MVEVPNFRNVLGESKTDYGTHFGGNDSGQLAVLALVLFNNINEIGDKTH